MFQSPQETSLTRHDEIHKFIQNVTWKYHAVDFGDVQGSSRNARPNPKGTLSDCLFSSPGIDFENQ